MTSAIEGFLGEMGMAKAALFGPTFTFGNDNPVVPHCVGI